MTKPILILKFGSAALTKADGTLNRQTMIEIARQTARLCPKWRIAIVSSGAVAAGRASVRGFSGQITERKAAAAVGNPLLLQQYAQYFGAYDIAVAQSLCERRHFADRRLFLQLQETFECLWQNGVVPIVNENDVVSDRELRFSDNDELATLLAVGFGAERLMLCTSAGGLLDESGNVVPKIKVIDEKIFSLVRSEKSTLGLGGMASKLTFTKLAARFGVQTHIFGLTVPEAIDKALGGEIGTLFLPQKSAETAKRRWLASGGLTTGRIQVDEGAADALRRRNSLLAVGIQKIIGQFTAGEIVEITDSQGIGLAVARMRLDAATVQANLNKQNVEVAHADDIVLIG